MSMKGWDMVSMILQVLLRRVVLGVGQFGAESGSSRESRDRQNPSGCSSGTVKPA